MTSFVEGIYSLGYLLSKREQIAFGEVQGFINKCQCRANEQDIDVVFRGLTTGALTEYKDYFGLCNESIYRAEGKDGSSYDYYFNAYIPEPILALMRSVA